MRPIALALLLATACTSFETVQFDAAPVAGGRATAGATAGGAQDIGLARDAARAGEIPRPESITAEGLFSEHDLPSSGSAADRVLSLRPGLALLRLPDRPAPSAIVQVGMASNVDLATFRRGDLDLAIVVDRSGSMAGGKIEAVRRALHRLVDQLGPRDRLALVLFDSAAEVAIESVPVESAGELREAIDAIEVRGSTDIEEGLALGFEQVQLDLDPGRADRVLLFTDALPNTGRTDPESFLGLAGRMAAEGVGLTVLGVGLDMGPELARRISELEGGSSFYLEDEERIAGIFDRDFDLLVTPIATRLSISVEPAPGFRKVAVYGVPGGDEDGLELEVATVFLSRNRGAIAIRLEPVAGVFPESPSFPIAAVRLAYRTPGGEEVVESLGVAYAGGSLVGVRRWSDGPGSRKLAALVETFTALREACRAWHERRHAGEADGHLAELERFLAAEVEETEDAGLGRELELVRRLRSTLAAPVRWGQEP